MTEQAQGILSGNEILDQIGCGSIRIDPFNEARINPASYDLTLGRHVAVYSAAVSGNFNASTSSLTDRKGIPGERLCSSYELHRDRVPFETEPGMNCLDAKYNNPVIRYEMDERGLLLRPGIGYLMHTAEHVWTDTFEPILDGKSSIGRLFTKVHETAGFGDPGFRGQYTLEVTTVHPVIVYPGMRFCQIRFHTIVGKVSLYDKGTGHYKGELAEGPVPSRAWCMFEEP